MAINGSTATNNQWTFQCINDDETEKDLKTQPLTVRTVRTMLANCIDESDKRLTIPLAHGDPSAFPCFQTSRAAEDAVVDAVRSAKFNGYSSSTGLVQARRYTLSSFFFLFFLLGGDKDPFLSENEFLIFEYIFYLICGKIEFNLNYCM